MVLFCRDCIYKIDSSSTPTRSFCAAPKATKYNLVTGDKIYDTCQDQRRDSKTEDTCGRSAIWYFKSTRY